MNLIPGEEYTMKSIDSPEDKNHSKESINTTEFPTELLNTLTVPGLPPHKLVLKRGQVVVLLRNWDLMIGHCNGVKYQVVNVKKHVVELSKISGDKVGSKLFIPRIVMLASTHALPFQLRRKQFPIKPCFGMSSNRSQGQTMRRIGIYMSQDFFSHGQLYVALSRCGDRSQVKILKRRGLGDKERPHKMINVVFKAVL